MSSPSICLLCVLYLPCFVCVVFCPFTLCTEFWSSWNFLRLFLNLAHIRGEPSHFIWTEPTQNISCQTKQLQYQSKLMKEKESGCRNNSNNYPWPIIDTAQQCTAVGTSNFTGSYCFRSKENYWFADVYCLCPRYTWINHLQQKPNLYSEFIYLSFTWILFGHKIELFIYDHTIQAT